MQDGRHDQFAAYAASRSISLLVLVLACVAFRRKQPLLAFACCMSIVQFADSWIGFHANDPAKTIGPLVFAVTNGILVYWLWKERRQGDPGQATAEQ
jgi:hypothetical protein